MCVLIAEVSAFSMCVNPIMVRNKSFGVKPGFLYNRVPCGKCYECLSRKRAEWVFRLAAEREFCLWPSWFVTLTYDDRYVPFYGVVKDDLQRFFKRLRINIQRSGFSSSLKYFFVSEYGPQTQRPHYHGIIFNMPDEYTPLIDQSWSLGFTHVGTAANESINYCSAYFVGSQCDVPPGKNACFRLMSRGLGLTYALKFQDFIRDSYEDMPFLNAFGLHSAYPRYYKDKLSLPALPSVDLDFSSFLTVDDVNRHNSSVLMRNYRYMQNHSKISHKL